MLQRELSIDTTTQLAGRALFACLALFGFVALLNRGRPVEAFPHDGPGRSRRRAVHGPSPRASFIVALNHATVANVLFMQAVAPVAAALLAWTAPRGGGPSRARAALAMAVALLGVGLMVGGPGSGGVVGVGASLIMTLAFAGSIVITRQRPKVSMAPAICLSQLPSSCSSPRRSPTPAPDHRIGISCCSYCSASGRWGSVSRFHHRGRAAHPRPPEVALITLLEVVLGPLWVWIALG